MDRFAPVLAIGVLTAFVLADEPAVKLFNGKDFTNWKVPVGDNGHWKIVDGVIDYDAKSEAKDDKNLWTERKFKDFVLTVDWRLKTDAPGYMNPRMKQVLPDGSNAKGPDGKDDNLTQEDIDSGIYLRGSDKSQINIWMWPVGSGEIYGYRTDAKMPADVRAGCVPKKKMDKPKGEWNTFEITVKGDRVWVKLNGEEVISGARLPGMPAEGPIGLQHHGAVDKEGKWTSPPSLVQFRNISVRELK